MYCISFNPIGKKMKLNRKNLLYIIFILLITSTQVAAEEWYISYERALDDIEDQNWGEAIKNLQEALADKPEPALRQKTVGLRYKDYLPYYYLGKAYYKQGKCQEALAALQNSLDYGIIKNKRDLYSDLEKMVADCQKKLTPVVQDQAVQNKPIDPKSDEPISESISDGDRQFIDQKYDEALVAYNTAKSLIEKSGDRKSVLPVVKEKIAKTNLKIKVRNSLDRVERFKKEGNYIEALSEARKLLVTDPDNTEVKRTIDNLVELQQLKAESVKSTSTIIPKVDKTETKEGYSKLMEESKKLFAQEDYKRAKSKVLAALELKEKDIDALQLLQRINYSEKIDDINYAIESYFKGNNVECKKKLDPAVQLLETMPEYKEKLKIAYVFQAAVLIDQHYVEGRTTDELLNEAKIKIKEIYRIDPAFKIDERYFSLKVVSAFKK